jgi:hypothetical protein
MCVADGSGARSFVVGILSMGPIHLGSWMGTVHGIYPWVSALVMRNLMGRHFWVGCGCFFLGGRGRGRGTPGHVMSSRFRKTTRVPNNPVYVIYYYMVNSGGFAEAFFQTIVKGVLDPRCHGYRTCVVQTSTTRRPVPYIEDSEVSVAPPSTTDSTEQWVGCHCGDSML